MARFAILNADGTRWGELATGPYRLIVPMGSEQEQTLPLTVAVMTDMGSTETELRHGFVKVGQDDPRYLSGLQELLSRNGYHLELIEADTSTEAVWNVSG